MTMESTLPFLKDQLSRSQTKNYVFQRNLLKEYLQVVVLDYLYAHPTYSQLVFYGGSCLAHCYNLPRLSENLAFVDLGKRIEMAVLAKDLKNHLEEKTDLRPQVRRQKFRLYLKFPILKKLGLAGPGESDLLFLKIEVYSQFDFCRQFKIETVPIFKFNQPILVKTFDQPTLMATKIMAVLHRRWEKTDKTGKILIRVKGRDYFDLWWYLNQGIKPNIDCIQGIKDQTDLRDQLLAAVKNLDAQSVRLDLEPLIADTRFVNQLGREIKAMLTREISTKLVAS